MSSKHRQNSGSGVEPSDSTRLIVGSILVAAFFIVLAIFYTGSGGNETATTNMNNVSMVGGKQIVELRAKGGYEPRRSFAKADVPTVLKINTDGTFDCSAIVRIPSLNIGTVLKNTGSTDIDLGLPSKGVIYGSCAMGMYPFELEFR